MAFESELFADQFLVDLDQRTVAREITNQDFTVVGARSVNVFAADKPSAQDKAADNSVKIQNPSGGSQAMTLDREKDLSMLIPSVEEFQSSVNMQNKFRERQAQAGEEDLDNFVLGMHGQAGTSIDTTATSASGFDDIVRDAKVALSDKDVPRSGRYMVLSPHYADLVSEAAGDRLTNNVDVELDGFLGRYQGFDLFETTGIDESGSSPGKQHLMFGHRVAITLAVQLNNVATIPDSEQAQYHGDILKALMVSGAEAFRPDALGVINADQPA